MKLKGILLQQQNNWMRQLTALDNVEVNQQIANYRSEKERLRQLMLGGVKPDLTVLQQQQKRVNETRSSIDKTIWSSL